MLDDLQERIHEENVVLHRLEARYYDSIHSEIFNRIEQKRISSVLRIIDKSIGQRKALDFGAGTGNLTKKLLQMGYEVTAIDISREMCEILKNRCRNHFKNGKLKVINSTIEDARLDGEEFDLICCYSVLHHLPDYAIVLQKLSGLLRKRGMMYLDHERSPYSRCGLAQKIEYAYLQSEWLFNNLYSKTTGLHVPSFDYSFADWWTTKEHSIDHRKIEHTLKKEGFRFIIRIDYHQKRGWFFNPSFHVYRRICRPETCLWLAKK